MQTDRLDDREDNIQIDFIEIVCMRIVRCLELTESLGFAVCNVETLGSTSKVFASYFAGTSVFTDKVFVS